MEDMMTKGIRSYGPGKFIKVIDSYAHEMTLDGGADREESYPEGGGWYGFIKLDRGADARIREIAVEEKDELTQDEEELLNKSVAVILFERSDGIVEADWFDDMEKADALWDEIEEELAGGDEDDDDEEFEDEEEEDDEDE